MVLAPRLLLGRANVWLFTPSCSHRPKGDTDVCFRLRMFVRRKPARVLLLV